jgi:hypothetical protein
LGKSCEWFLKNADEAPAMRPRNKEEKPSARAAETDRMFRARRGLAIYFTVVVIGTGMIDWMLIRAGDSIDRHVLSGQYATSVHPAGSASLFVVRNASNAIVIGSLRLSSGSIWPAVLLHGTWNAVIQGPFDNASRGGGHDLWLGESGVLVALTCLCAAVVVARRKWVVCHWPGEKPNGEEAPNKPDAANPAITSLLHARRHSRGGADPERWAA